VIAIKGLFWYKTRLFAAGLFKQLKNKCLNANFLNEFCLTDPTSGRDFERIGCLQQCAKLVVSLCYGSQRYQLLQLGLAR
jgi:hypothetical protein